MSNFHSKSYGKKNYGAERAAQHIQEAKEFSEEVGGTDEDVKAYFFSIDNNKKEEILTLYGQEYGSVPEEWARKTWHSWASGKTKMSGLVAKRLFALLPEHMPVSAKLNMVESLWNHCCPKSKENIQIDSRSNIESVIEKVTEHFNNKIGHDIPDNFTRRFNWLSGQDSQIKQQLLNHFKKLELNVVGVSLEEKLKVVCDHLRNNQNISIKGSHTITIGNHHLSLNFDNSIEIAERKRKEEAKLAEIERLRQTELRRVAADRSEKMESEIFIVIIVLIVCAFMFLIIVNS